MGVFISGKMDNLGRLLILPSDPVQAAISHGIFLVTLADTVMSAFTKKGFPKGNCDGLEIVFIGKFSNNPSKCDQLAGGESSESQPMMVET